MKRSVKFGWGILWASAVTNWGFFIWYLTLPLVGQAGVAMGVGFVLITLIAFALFVVLVDFVLIKLDVLLWYGFLNLGTLFLFNYLFLKS